MQATPLQMANVAATVVNGGTLYRPHLVKEIRTPTGKVIKRFDSEVIREVPVTRESLREVKEGMSRVTGAGGTGYGLAIPGLPFGGKTGTVETDGGHGPNTTWFVAFAPADHPVLTMAIFVERSGGYGASVAGPIARQILVKYFNKKP
jgi:cell division protein FtsI/penicillin-binding protein 2